MKRVIPNNITVSEQFVLFKKFNDTVDHEWRKHAKQGTYENINLKRDFVEEKFGIRCEVSYTDYRRRGRLIEPRIVDEKKCLFYLIKQCH